MKESRGKIYICPSWLSKLVAGESQCEWCYWFKSHFTYDKRPSDFNLAKWNMEHNKLLRKRRDELEKLDFEVFIESQNEFKHEFVVEKESDAEGEIGAKIGTEVTTSGKCDIIAIKKGCALIDDCKTGKPRNSDQFQVILYMMIVPKAIEKYKGVKFAGNIIYRDGIPNAPVPSSAAEDESLIEEIKRFIKIMAGPEENCRKVPSRSECSWCDITRADCPQKWDA